MVMQMNMQLISRKLFFLFFILLFSRLDGSDKPLQEVAESEIADKVKNELNLQLDGIGGLQVRGDSKKHLRKKISYAVNREINSQIYSRLHKHAKKKEYDKNSIYNYKNDGIPFIYKVPKWPVQSLFFLKKDSIGFHANAQFATQAFGSSGGTKDISQLVFQEGSIRIKDILFASKLIDMGLATPSDPYTFLNTLKDQTLSFDASVYCQEFALSYIRHFLRGDVSLGLFAPVVRKKHKIKLKTTLSPTTNETIQSNPDSVFFSRYPNGLIDFFKDILSKKGMSFDEKDVEFGIGDVEAFFKYEIMSRYCERCFVGFRVLFPTSSQRDIYKLWDPELGSGGFAELSVFGSLLFGKASCFNPHVFVQASYPVPRKVMRRVPRLRRDEDITVKTARAKFGEDFTPFGNNITQVGAVSFSELDAIVRRFSDTAKKTKIRPGGEVFARIGNMFERIFSERLFFDLFYDICAKAKSYTGFRHSDDVYDPTILTNNSFRVDHRIGGNISYQFNDSWRIHGGALYTFAGRNTLKNLEVNGVLTVEF
jgi:hypothetical protein